MIQCGERCYSLLTPLYSLLAFGAVGPIRPSLVRGLRPRNAPSPTTSRRSQCVGNTKLATRVGPALPPANRHIPKMCQARASQARPLPFMPNVHRHDHREPATQILTVHFPQADRTQYTHRTWLSSYLSFMNDHISFLIEKLPCPLVRILRATARRPRPQPHPRRSRRRRRLLSRRARQQRRTVNAGARCAGAPSPTSNSSAAYR